MDIFWAFFFYIYLNTGARLKQDYYGNHGKVAPKTFRNILRHIREERHEQFAER